MPRFLNPITITTPGGSAPLVVNSSTVVSNLNADLLDGQHGSYYAAASSLGNYLPLTGGTLTGSLYVDNNDAIRVSWQTNDHLWIRGYGLEFGRVTSYLRPGSNNVASLYVGGSAIGQIDWANIDFYSSGRFSLNNNPILHAGNYSSYALPLTGGTLTGQLNANGGVSLGAPIYYSQYTRRQISLAGPSIANFGNWKQFIRLWAATGAGGNLFTLKVSVRGSWNWTPVFGTVEAYYSLYLPGDGTIYGGAKDFRITHVSGPATDNVRLGDAVIENGYVSIPVWCANSNPLEATVEQWNGSQILGSTTTAVSETLPAFIAPSFRGGLTSDGGLNVNGDLQSGGAIIRASASTAGHAWLSTAAYGVSQGDGRTHFGYNTGTQYENYIRGAHTVVDGSFQVVGAVTAQSTLAVTGAITQNGNQVLHAGNYSSYALPLTGGTLTGKLSINSTGAWNDAQALLTVGSGGDGRIQVRHIWGKNAANNNPDHLWLNYQNSGAHVQIGDNGQGNNLYVSGQIYAGGYFGGSLVLNAGNYSSYALPLTGGALTGTISIDTTGTTALVSSVIIKRSGQSAVNFGQYAGSWRSALQIQSNSSDRLLFLAPPEADHQFGILRAANGGLKIDVGGTTADGGVNAVTINTAGTANFPVGLSGTTGSFSGEVTWSGWNSGNPRAVRIGYSGGDYGGISYGINYTATSGSHTYAIPDAVTRIDLADGIQVYSAATGTVGAAVSWTTLLTAYRGNDSLQWKGVNVLDANNYTNYTLPRSGSWYGVNLPGSRWGGFSANGGEIVFGQNLPNTGQMGVLIDGCYIAGENNGFWSLASSNDWATRRGMYFDGTYLRFDYNSATAYFSNASINGNQVLHASNYNSYALPLTGGTLTGALNGISAYFSGNIGAGVSPTYRIQSNAPAMLNRTAFGVLDISSNGSPNFIKIQTAIPFSYLAQAYTVNIKGFAYDSSQTVDLAICWHQYADTFYATALTSKGSFAPTVRLARESGNVVICLTWSGKYWPKLYVESVHNYDLQAYSTGWTWVDADITGDKVVTLSYKNDWGGGMTKDINGNLTVAGSVAGSSFSGAGTGLTGTAAGLSIGGTAATATTANSLNAANNYQVNSIGVGMAGSGIAGQISLNQLGIRSWTITPSGGNLNLASGDGNGAANFSVALQQGGNQVLHAGNYSSYALPLTGGTLTGTLTAPTLQLANGFQIQQGASNYGQFNTWVHLNGSYGFYSSVNGAHLYPNNASYGSWRMDGTRNGWGGIEFGNNGVSLMMGSDTVGFHQNTNGWLLRVHQGVGYVYKGSWGGGTAAAILDSSNVASYALPIGGGTLTGALSGTSASFSGALSSGGNSVLTVGNYSSYAVDNTKRVKQFFWDGLSASTTQARRYEIARIAIDIVNWNQVGTFEIDLCEQYYTKGIKKRYAVWYGYSGTRPGLKLVEMTGAGDNNFQVVLGTEQPVSGNQYYLPIYVDVRYYSIVDVRVTTSRQIAGSNPPPVGYTYINSSPTPTNIPDFTADSTVDLSPGASAWLVGGNVLLHGGNFNSYAPTLTGTGASGTWGISISGSAVSATTQSKSDSTTSIATTAFSKWLFATFGTGGTTDWNHVSNTMPGAGTTLLRGNDTNGFGPSQYYHPVNFEYAGTGGTGNVTQLAVAYGLEGNDLRMRGRYSGTWTSWVQFLNSSNYNSYSPTLTGGGASGTWGISISGSAAQLNGQAASFYQNAGNLNAGTLPSARLSGTYTIDIAGASSSGSRLGLWDATAYITGSNTISGAGGRGVNLAPNTYVKQISFEFKNTSFASMGGNYGGLITIAPWDGTAVSTGDPNYQLLFSASAANSTSNPVLRLRAGIDAGWGAWATLIHDANFATAIPNSGVGAGTYNNVTVNAKGIVTGGSNVSYLTGNQSITLSGDVSGSGTTAITATIGAGAVTYAKIQNVAISSVLGNSSASVAQAPQALSMATLAGMLSGQTMNIAGSSTSCTGNAATATNVAWSGITSKPTTLSGYGITDALSTSGGTVNGNLTIGSGFQHLASDGTAAAPGYSFSADTNTGICRTAADTMGLVAGGIVRASIDSNGINAVNGSALLVYRDGSASISPMLYWANAANNRAYNWQLDTGNNATLWSYNGTAWASIISITSAGSLTASSFSGAGTGLTGTASSLTAGAVAWSGVTGKPTTLSGYGITDAINTSATAQTKSGDLTVGGNFVSNGTATVKSNGTRTGTALIKFAQTIGDNYATSFNVDHNLSTTDVLVQVVRLADGAIGNYTTSIVTATANRVTVTFAAAPTTSQYRVVVVG